MRVKTCVVTMLVVMMAMLIGCGTELNQTNNEKKEVAIEWENVFETMERYDLRRD